MSRTVWFALAALAAATPAAAAAPNGEALFRRECAICHLKGGTGAMMLERRLGADKALLLDRKDLTAVYVKRVVRYGVNSMPRFTRAELPNDDLDAVAAYLLRNNPPPAR
jgi:mono/diheme cytochrome c family protein